MLPDSSTNLMIAMPRPGA